LSAFTLTGAKIVDTARVVLKGGTLRLANDASIMTDAMDYYGGLLAGKVALPYYNGN
jgi:hypothetical protein